MQHSVILVQRIFRHICRQAVLHHIFPFLPSRDHVLRDPHLLRGIRIDMSSNVQSSRNDEGPSSTSSSKPNLTSPSSAFQTFPPNIKYVQYSLDLEPLYLPQIRELISKDLSEPYSIYVYRYFLYQWAELCFMALDTNHHTLVGVVICKLERHRGGPMRGYIAMLATSEKFRGKGIATTLVSKAIDLMIERDADEIALETEETNTAAMKLYERLGFLKSKKLHRYYLNGNSAYRLLLYLKEGVGDMHGDYDAYRDLPPSAQDDPEFPPDADELYSRGIV
jgi:N-alpha-acetyltransferase 30